MKTQNSRHAQNFGIGLLHIAISILFLKNLEYSSASFHNYLLLLDLGFLI